MSEGSTFADWILEDNLKPFVETLSGLVGYGFYEWDCDAIRYGVIDTDVEAERWYEYELTGERNVQLRLARDPGSIVIFVRLQTDQNLAENVAAVAEVMGSYYLSEGPKGRG